MNKKLIGQDLEALFQAYDEDRLEMNALDMDFFMQAYAKHKNLPFVALEKYEIKLMQEVPSRYLNMYQAVFFKEDEEYIFLALCKPCSLELQDKFQSFFKDKLIKIHLANPFKLRQKLDEFLSQESFEELLLSLKYELKNTHSSKDQSAVNKLLEFILQSAIKQNASDIHIEPLIDKTLLRFRSDGILHESFSLEKELAHSLIFYIKLLAHLNVAEQRKAQDGSFNMEFEAKRYDFRIASLPLVYGESLVLRILEHKKEFLEPQKLGFDTGFLEILRQNIHKAHGLILVCGPTGSGKSTTLYGILNEIKSSAKKIISVEDPIEYKLDGVQQIVLNEKAGLDFNNALRAILRQDPDVIMIGEIRDEESLDIALKASLTGHLVFATLHTNDAVLALSRMLDMKAKPYLIASSLRLIIAQRLVRKLCVHCRVKSIKTYEGIEGEFYEARGCEYCHHKGFKGRELLGEFLSIDENLSELIRQNASKNEILKQAKGFQSMFELGLQKARQGITSVDELLRVLG